MVSSPADFPAPTAHLDVADLTVRYASTRGEVTAVDLLSLTADAGEVVAVLGPSGCGKSTLLRTIAGLEPATGGRIHLAGRDLDGVRPDRRDVGLAFQDHALFPHRSVADNVGFGPRVRGWPRAEIDARIAEVLALVDLGHLRDRMPSELSGGEQQRVALARAIAPRPSLLMLDEPLGALDRVLRDRLLADLPGVFAELDATVLYVTHDHDEALTLADRVAVMRRGRFAQVAAPDVLWRRPADVEVARFLGLDQLLPAEVADGSASTPIGRIPAEDAPTGPATVLVLPDAVRLGDEDAGCHHELAVAGTVRARRFTGDRVIVEVVSDAGPTLRVTVRPTRAPTVGARCQLAVDTAHVRILPPAAS